MRILIRRLTICHETKSCYHHHLLEQRRSERRNEKSPYIILFLFSRKKGLSVHRTWGDNTRIAIIGVPTYLDFVSLRLLLYWTPQ